MPFPLIYFLWVLLLIISTWPLWFYFSLFFTLCGVLFKKRVLTWNLRDQEVRKLTILSSRLSRPLCFFKNIENMISSVSLSVSLSLLKDKKNIIVKYSHYWGDDKCDHTPLTEQDVCLCVSIGLYAGIKYITTDFHHHKKCCKIINLVCFISICWTRS